MGWQVRIGQVIMERGKERVGRYFIFLGLMMDAVPCFYWTAERGKKAHVVDAVGR